MTSRSEHIVLIPGRLPSMNEWVYANRSSWYIGNNMKQDAESRVSHAIRSALHGVRIEPPVEIEYRFREENLNRDLDNITSFAAKVFQDALVKECILKNDTPRYIKRMISSVARDKENPHIEIIIREVE